VQAALDAAADKEWEVAIKHYTTALQLAPNTDLATRASLTHDLAILNEKAGNKAQAIEQSQLSAKLFAEAKIMDAQVHALDTTSGIFARAGNKPQADEFAKQAGVLRAANNLNPVTLNTKIQLANLSKRPVLEPRLLQTNGIATGRVAGQSLNAGVRAAAVVIPSTPSAPASRTTWRGINFSAKSPRPTPTKPSPRRRWRRRRRAKPSPSSALR
jgi:hypothetical protein